MILGTAGFGLVLDFEIEQLRERAVLGGVEVLLHPGECNARAGCEFARKIHSDTGKLGIVNRVVPDAELAAVTVAFAKKLAAGPRIALALMKRNFNAAENGSLAELLDLEAKHQTETGRTEDHKEAARAFVEKRAPVFRGR